MNDACLRRRTASGSSGHQPLASSPASPHRWFRGADTVFGTLKRRLQKRLLVRRAVPIAARLAEIEEAARGADRIFAINKAVDAHKQGVRHPLVWGLVAEGLEIQGRKAEALRLLQLSAEAAPGVAQTWFRLGKILFSLDRRVEARDALDRGLTIAPRDYGALIDAGTVCLRLGDLVAAAGHFQAAAEVDPKAAEPHSAQAVVAALDGDMAAARAFAAHALAISPGLVSAQIAIARADAAEGAPGLAEQRLTALLERRDLSDAQQIDAFDLRAECRDALGRCSDALTITRDAMP